MHIPDTLKIGGHTYRVEIVQTSKKLGSSCNAGMTHLDSNLIEIDASLCESQIEETFFHEVLHAINNGLSHEVIYALGQQLHQVFRDNGLLKQKDV